VLVARAAGAREALPEGLRERGAAVDVVSLYDTVAEPLSAAQRQSLAGATYVTFTSSSTVRFFLEGGAEVGDARVVSIGPVTSETLREHRIEPHVEAARHDIDGLVAAIVQDVGR
jgi:uroporphyrinogen III methyltransferase / synthase